MKLNNTKFHTHNHPYTSCSNSHKYCIIPDTSGSVAGVERSIAILWHWTKEQSNGDKVSDMLTIEMTYLVPINAISNQKARPWIIPVLISSKSRGITTLHDIHLDHMTSHDQFNRLTCTYLTHVQSQNW